MTTHIRGTGEDSFLHLFLFLKVLFNNLIYQMSYLMYALLKQLHPFPLFKLSWELWMQELRITCLLFFTTDYQLHLAEKSSKILS